MGLSMRSLSSLCSCCAASNSLAPPHLGVANGYLITFPRNCSTSAAKTGGARDVATWHFLPPRPRPLEPNSATRFSPSPCIPGSDESFLAFSKADRKLSQHLKGSLQLHHAFAGLLTHRIGA